MPVVGMIRGKMISRLPGEEISVSSLTGRKAIK